MRRRYRWGRSKDMRMPTTEIISRPSQPSKSSFRQQSLYTISLNRHRKSGLRTSASTLGYSRLLLPTRLAICAHARPVLIGPDPVSVALGSTLSADVAGNLVSVTVRPKSNVSACAAATATSAGSAMSDLIARNMVGFVAWRGEGKS